MSRLSKILLTIGAALLVMQLPSCAPEDSSLSRRLDKAEELMETRPDSALSILRTIDGTRIGNRSQNARYALLYSQALDKNYIDVTNDSLISIAVDYYQSKKESSELMKALYYQATIYKNNSDFSDAVVPAIESYRLAGKENDRYRIAKSAQLLATIYYGTYNDLESCKYWQIAADEFKLCGRDKESAFALLGKISPLNELEQTESSINILDSLQTSSSELFNDTSFAYSFYSRALNTYSSIELKDSILKTADMILDNRFDNFRSASDYSLLAQFFIDEPRKAKEYIEEGRNRVYDSTGRNNLLYAELCFANKYANQSEFKESVDAFMKASSEETLLHLKHPASLAEIKYNRKLLAKESELSMLRLWLGIAAVLILGFITLTIIFLFRRKVKRHRNIVAGLEFRLQKSDNQLSKIKDEKNSLESAIIRNNEEIILLKENIEKLKIRIEETEHLNASIIEEDDKLCKILEHLKKELLRNFEKLKNRIEEFVESNHQNPDSSDDSASLMDVIGSYIENENEDNLFDVIDRYNNLLFDNIMIKINETENSSFTKTEIKVISLVLAGFSRKSICMILNMKPGTVYTHRNRIGNKISADENSPMNKYLPLFSNKEYFSNRLRSDIEN